MTNSPEHVDSLSQSLLDHSSTLIEWEKRFAEELSLVHPNFRHSAENLIHYMAMREVDIERWQRKASDLAYPIFTQAEASVIACLDSFKTIADHVNGIPKISKTDGALSPREAGKLLKRNVNDLFGYKSKKRRTRIMVTIPLEAAEDPNYARKLVTAGMNCARINCAHDSEREWKSMIENVRNAAREAGVEIKIMMDLAGPKLRTGPIDPGPKVARIRPDRDDLGRTTNPARIRLGVDDNIPWSEAIDTFVPVDGRFLREIKSGSRILFTDTRNKNCEIIIDRIEGDFAYGSCGQSSYLQSGTTIVLISDSGDKVCEGTVGELPPKEQAITLRKGDRLLLDNKPTPGSNTEYDEAGRILRPARISCQLPEVFADVKSGESIFFDDGKIEGRITNATEEFLEIEITQARNDGSKLKADKGINLPRSELRISGLTNKDKADLPFVAKNADTVNYSFVNREEDVDELITELAKCGGQRVGIILKIETIEAFRNLPRLLLRAMQTYPVGVMLARGDLAIEAGWGDFPQVQEEILRTCEASHIPDVWATQVLESLAKKGTPTRSEVTDAAQAQRAECVMLNKGRYTVQAIELLDRILRKMQRYQKKKMSIRPKLKNASKLKLDLP